METKSEGQLQFDHGLAEIQKRIVTGEYTDPIAPGRDYSKLRDDLLPQMTASERDAIQRAELRAHQLGADMFAELGRPVPGNDRSKPN
jgi:hypothetical protein